jgi:hypothetical protein
MKKIFILLTKLLDKYLVENCASENTNKRMFRYKRDVLRYKKVRGKWKCGTEMDLNHVKPSGNYMSQLS